MNLRASLPGLVPMSMWLLITGTLALSAAAAPPAPAAPQARPVVVELFTSEGCSSCPPADALLGELAGRPGVLALAFHVDYWDSLGWRDPFGLAVSAERQSRYATLLSRTGAYTPQAIVDGAQSVVGSDRPFLTAATSKVPPGVLLQVALVAGNVVIRLDPHSDKRACDIEAVTFLAKAVTRVGRGENAGRSLTEFNIVRSIRRLGTWSGDAAEFKVPLATLPADATGFAVLVQSPNQGPILGAATLALR